MGSDWEVCGDEDDPIEVGVSGSVSESGVELCSGERGWRWV